jgi:putative Holliday junction resolvase
MVEYPILAIDYGKKHFGLAISDFKGIIASPLEVLSITKNQDQTEIISQILDICKEYRVKSILIGYPQAFVENHMRTQKNIDRFKRKLEEKTSLPIILYDESFSTTSAQNMLISSGQTTKGFRSKIDKVAATVFLQEFLNSEYQKNGTTH